MRVKLDYSEYRKKYIYIYSPKANQEREGKKEQFLYTCFSKSQIERGGGNHAFFSPSRGTMPNSKQMSPPSLFLSGHSNQIMQKDPSDPNKVKKWPFT